jgi:acyl-CoA thioesterase YciA
MDASGPRQILGKRVPMDCGQRVECFSSSFSRCYDSHDHAGLGKTWQESAPMNTRAATEHPPQTEPALRAIAMPADANPHGDIFGGWLLSQMDLAGGTAATRRARGRTATVAITAMTFHRPVFIGDEVTCYAEIIKVGTTSITVKVESWVRRGTGEEHIAVTEGIFTYVAVGSDRRPRPVPLES